MIHLTFNPNSAKKLLFALLTLIAITFSVDAEPLTVSIKDWTGRGFAPDIVTYTISTPAKNGQDIRVLDSNGKSLSAQITPIAGITGKSSLSFIASVTPGGVSTYTISDNGKANAAQPAVSMTKDGDEMVLANQMLAVKVPALQEKKFAQSVSADSLPAPVLAFRGADGAWRGAGTLLLKRMVKSFSVVKSAEGPVYTEIIYHISYADGGYYRASVRVADQAPFARIREEYDLGKNADTDFWQLDMSKGWQPDAVEHMSVAGQGNSPVVYPTIANEEKTVASGANVGTAFPGSDGDPVRCIHHDSCWGSKFVSYYGIHSAESRKADPANYPLAMVAPLHKGDWRRSGSLPVYIKNGVVQVRFPMSVTPTSWKFEPRSDVSPFSCHEHDPSLPATYGRRDWALVLAKPAFTVVGYNDKTTAAVGYAVRVLYGLVGLDRYKDFILNWTDTKPTYPRVFTTLENLKKIADPVEGYKTQQGGGSLQENISYIINSISIHHHHTLSAYGAPIAAAENALANPMLPDANRQQIRGQLALLSYLLVDPDVTSAGNGSHHGNPNMGVSRLSDRSNVIALIPDHPMHKAWSSYTGMFTAYKMGSFMAPEGGWFEYGASYQMHGYGKIERGIMGILSSNSPQANQMWNYNRTGFDYFLNLLSPTDPRFGSRVIPGMANSPNGQSPHYLQAMGTVADRDPDFAGNLRWAWDVNGRMSGTGADAITIPNMIRPWISAKEPVLTSRIYPGFGVIFRAHQGADETCLYLRSGYLWSHWNQDQNNMILYSKGSVLLPPQPYQYGGPKDKNFPDKNFIRFADPGNDFPHDWADSNIIDASFGKTVDYAWASSGYPDWYINPGARAGWEAGNKRGFIPDLNQKEGAFSWDRQIAFIKGSNSKSPNYFVVRDSMNSSSDPYKKGGLASWFNLSLLGRKNNITVDGSKVVADTEWPTKLEMIFTNRDKPNFEMVDDTLPMQNGSYNNGGKSKDWVNGGEQHVALRLQNAPGQDIAWVIYPRGENETAPGAVQLANGVTKVTTAESTDYVFLSAVPINYKGEGIEFSGLSGAVRVANDGKTTLVLSSGPGKVGYKGTVINSAVPFEKIISADSKSETIPSWWTIKSPVAVPDGQKITDVVVKGTGFGMTQYIVNAPTTISAADGDVKIHARKATIEINKDSIRFVVPERAYVQLSVGNVGVRGVGPFDLTFTADDITGKVDGEIRTIVTTWPQNITRPGYTMDSVRWYAGFADEHSIVKGTKTPQFGIAIGVSSGPHVVKIAEWEWPVMPPVPVQTELAK